METISSVITGLVWTSRDDAVVSDAESDAGCRLLPVAERRQTASRLGAVPSLRQACSSSTLILIVPVAFVTLFSTKPTVNQPLFHYLSKVQLCTEVRRVPGSYCNLRWHRIVYIFYFYIIKSTRFTARTYANLIPFKTSERQRGTIPSTYMIWNVIYVL